MNHEERLKKWKLTAEGKSHCKQFVKHLKSKSRKNADVVKKCKEEVFSKLDRSNVALLGAIGDYDTKKVQREELS